jgi:simple sugar transport system permease protein
MPQSLPQTGQPKRRFKWPTGTPQILALILVLVVDSLVAPHFFQIVLQDGRLFGSPIDILNRAAPVALLAIGMTLVIATGGIDLSVGAVMAIAGATAASMTVAGYGLPIVLLAALGTGILAGLWNGVLVAILKIQPFVATLILMVAGRGVAQLITSGQIVTFNAPNLAWIGSGKLCCSRRRSSSHWPHWLSSGCLPVKRRSACLLKRWGLISARRKMPG